jgi:hypothetical protein
MVSMPIALSQIELWSLAVFQFLTKEALLGTLTRMYSFMRYAMPCSVQRVLAISDSTFRITIKRTLGVIVGNFCEW